MRPMRILYITNDLPWPLTSGYLCHFHFIRELSVRHRVTLLSLVRPTTDRAAVEFGRLGAGLASEAPFDALLLSGERPTRSRASCRACHSSPTCAMPRRAGSGARRGTRGSSVGRRWPWRNDLRSADRRRFRRINVGIRAHAPLVRAELIWAGTLAATR